MRNFDHKFKIGDCVLIPDEGPKHWWVVGVFWRPLLGCFEYFLRRSMHGGDQSGPTNESRLVKAEDQV
jgi:hypothetical protein